MSMLLTACGLSEENKTLIKDNQIAISDAKKEAETIYGSLTDETYSTDIEELSNKSKEFEEIDIDSLKDDDVEWLVAEMTALKDSYDTLLEKLNAEYEKEKAATEDAEKYKEILCYIENKSGFELSSIIISDTTRKEDSGNILADGETLPTDRILAGVAVTIHEDSTERMLTATDTSGTEYTYNLSLTDIPSLIESGMSIQILAPESGLRVGAYTTEEISDEDIEAAEEESITDIDPTDGGGSSSYDDSGDTTPSESIDTTPAASSELPVETESSSSTEVSVSQDTGSSSDVSSDTESDTGSDSSDD